MAKHHDVPVFIVYPLVSPYRMTGTSKHSIDNGDVVNSNGCELFCGNRHFLFGVLSSKWQEIQNKEISSLIVS